MLALLFQLLFFLLQLLDLLINILLLHICDNVLFNITVYVILLIVILWILFLLIVLLLILFFCIVFAGTIILIDWLSIVRLYRNILITVQYCTINLLVLILLCDVIRHCVVHSRIVISFNLRVNLNKLSILITRIIKVKIIPIDCYHWGV